MAGRSDFGALARMAALVLVSLYGDQILAQSPLDEAKALNSRVIEFYRAGKAG